MIYPLIQKLLFSLPPETAHHFTLQSLKWLHKLGVYPSSKPSNHSAQTLMGLSFPNRIGLGAGLDKNGEYIDGLAALGFGFIEIGTITPKPQPGNPKPRLFRIPQAGAIINRMGFNNHGVEALIQNVQKSNYKGILGINIGKNATTPLENAADDYVFCLEKVYPYASYIVVNISSPNTPGLRQLQQVTDLDPLLQKLKESQARCQAIHQKYVPLVIKISPDMEEDALKELAKNLLKHNIDGVTATNTTLSRVGVEGLVHGEETGGLGGRPVFERSLETVKKLHLELAGKIPIIGCGGIRSTEDAQKMLDAGAKLIQVYTGLVYEGPGLVQKLTSLSTNQQNNRHFS